MQPPVELTKGQTIIWLGEPVIALYRARMWRHWHYVVYFVALITLCTLPTLLRFPSAYHSEDFVLSAALDILAWLCVMIVFLHTKNGGVDMYVVWYALTAETFLVLTYLDGGNELFTYLLSDLKRVRLEPGRGCLTCWFRSSPPGCPRRVVVRDISDLPTLESLLKTSCAMSYTV